MLVLYIAKQTVSLGRCLSIGNNKCPFSKDLVSSPVQRRARFWLLLIVLTTLQESWGLEVCYVGTVCSVSNPHLLWSCLTLVTVVKVWLNKNDIDSYFTRPFLRRHLYKGNQTIIHLLTNYCMVRKTLNLRNFFATVKLSIVVILLVALCLWIPSQLLLHTG